MERLSSSSLTRILIVACLGMVFILQVMQRRDANERLYRQECRVSGYRQIIVEDWLEIECPDGNPITAMGGDDVWRVIADYEGTKKRPCLVRDSEGRYWIPIEARITGQPQKAINGKQI